MGGYCKMGLSNLWQPNLRCAPAALLSRRVCWRWRQAHWCSRTRAPRTRRSPCFIAAPHSMLTRVVRPRGLIERNITAVAQGRRTKEEVLAEAVQCFRADYLVAAQKQGALRPAVPAPGRRRGFPHPPLSCQALTVLAPCIFCACSAAEPLTVLAPCIFCACSAARYKCWQRCACTGLQAPLGGVSATPRPAAGIMEAEVAQFFPRAAGGGGGGDAELPPGGQPLGPCPRCGLPLLLCRRDGETAFVACSSAVCQTRVYLPRGTLAAEVAEAACGACRHGAVRMLALRCAAPSPARWPTRRRLASELAACWLCMGAYGQGVYDVSMARCARSEARQTQDTQTDVRSSVMCAQAGPCFCRLCDMVMPPAGFGRRCCRSGTMLP